MDFPFSFEDDLDEEKAKRSIKVTNVPENITPKDIVIHFQRESNGGGEVVNLEDHGNEHRSSVVITFEHPSIVESAIKPQQIIKGSKVTVQRYPVETKITEIFSDVYARINPSVIHDSSTPSLQQVLHSLRHDFGIKHSKNEYGDVIHGSYRQITLCRKHILDEIRNCKSSRKPPGSAHTDMKIQAVSPEEMGATSRSTATNVDEKIDAVKFQYVPIILKFIFSVSKYARRIQDIVTKFNVKIDEDKGGFIVVITPLPGCTKKQHDDACEEYISLYREVYDGPMMSKDILLRPGNGSIYSAKDAVREVLQIEPIVIQEMDKLDMWQFYGEETNVKSAIKSVCKMLNIKNPLQKIRKAMKSVDEEENRASASHSHMPSRNDEREEEVLHYNIRSPIRKDFPGNEAQPFVIETKRGFRLKVFQGDITREQVDVIVSSTDKHLDFSFGLPATIVERGGRIIQKEAEDERRNKKLKPGDVVVTGPGRLSCSNIMHILTNKYKDTKTDSEIHKKLIKDACLHCLKLAQRGKSAKSIAFPAVGSGRQEVPLNVCASAMISAVEDYMKQSNSNKNAVTDIRFVHFDLAAVEAFKVELRKRYKDSIVVTNPGEADITKRSKHSTLTLPSDKSTGSSTVKKTEKREEEDVCPICLDGFHDPVTMSKCNHKFCKQCIDQAFQHRKVCPTCGMAYGLQTGNMPYGTMNYYLDNYARLPGYEGCGTIRIDYNFPSGTQGPGHPNPGQRYSGTSRIAYLPDCPEGREVLDLLKKAFNARLTFTIGRSVTTGVSNTVTWNDIHHKTNIYGGPTGFGYPDPGYLKRVKDELAAKGIS